MGIEKPTRCGTNKLKVASSRSERGSKIRIFCKQILLTGAESAFPEHRPFVMK